MYLKIGIFVLFKCLLSGYGIASHLSSGIRYGNTLKRREREARTFLYRINVSHCFIGISAKLALAKVFHSFYICKGRSFCVLLHPFINFKEQPICSSRSPKIMIQRSRRIAPHFIEAIGGNFLFNNGRLGGGGFVWVLVTNVGPS